MRDPCTQSRQLRTRIALLLEQGRLDRTLRVIAAANTLCPSERRETWVVEASTQAEIGRYDDARAILEEIHATGRDEPWEARHAAQLADMRSRNREDREKASQETQERFVQAAAIEAQARSLRQTASEKELSMLHARASAQFVEAWEAFHPAGEALYRAGHNAKLAGDTVSVQRLFDRALVELERRKDPGGRSA